MRRRLDSKLLSLEEQRSRLVVHVWMVGLDGRGGCDRHGGIFYLLLSESQRNLGKTCVERRGRETQDWMKNRKSEITNYVHKLHATTTAKTSSTNCARHTQDGNHFLFKCNTECCLKIEKWHRKKSQRLSSFDKIVGVANS